MDKVICLGVGEKGVRLSVFEELFCCVGIFVVVLIGVCGSIVGVLGMVLGGGVG